MLKFYVFSIILAICKVVFVSSLLFKYDLEFLSEDVFTPCEKFPNITIETFADISQVEMNNNDDGSVTVEGEFELIHDFKRERYNCSVEFYKRERGTWQKTLYSVKRDDLCSAFFNPKEIWAPYFQQIPEEQRKCPMKKGSKYKLSITTKDPIEFVDRNMAGEYNMRFECGFPNDPDEYLCLNLFVNLHRH